jgi:hypothetical protein
MKRTRKLRAAEKLIPLLVAMLTASCSAVTGDKVCTLIGCSSGLVVVLPSVPGGPYSVELLLDSPTPGARYMYECAGGPACQGEIFFAQVTPPRALVRVTTSTGVRLTEVTTVNYVRSQPNGPDCGPTCFTARINADLPVPP